MLNMNIVQVNVSKGQAISKQLSIFLQKNEIHIVGISEPYTNNLDGKACLVNANYTTISSNRNRNINNKLRSKAAMLVKKNLNFIVDDELSDELFVIVTIKNLTIVACYMEPSVTKDGLKTIKDIKIELNKLSRIVEKYSNNKLIILTDSNSKHTSWGNRMCKGRDKERADNMYQFIIDYELKLLNDVSMGPTFTKLVQETNSEEITLRKSYIDLTMINNKIDVKNCEWSLLSEILNTEHKLIKITLKEDIVCEIQRIKKIDYEATDWIKYIETFNERKPYDFQMNNMECTINQFNNAIKEADRHIKYKEKSVSNKLQWYNDEIGEINRNIFRITRKLSTLGKMSKKYLELKMKLKELNKKFKDKIKESMKKFVIRSNSVSSPEEFWKLWKKSKFVVNSYIPVFKNNEAKTVEENQRIISEYFIKSTENDYVKMKFKSSLVLENTTKEELQMIINKMNNQRAPGPDEIPPKLIKILYSKCENYFVDLFNYILKLKQLPES